MKKWQYASWPEGRPPCRECRYAIAFYPGGRNRLCGKAMDMARTTPLKMEKLQPMREGCKHWEEKTHETA